VWAILLATFCLLSLAGSAPVRSLEQLAASLAGLLDGLGGDLRAPRTESVADADRAAADDAWVAWMEAVAGQLAAARPGRQALLVPVVEWRRGPSEIVIRVPAGTVREGAAVTHRDVLLGFVGPVEADAGQAVVRLLRHSAARPVAGEWRSAPGARPVHFLARSRDGRLHAESRSSTVSPGPDLLAVTRDVSFLGDLLPAGLILGRLVSDDRDEPGGGLAVGGRGVQLDDLVNPYQVGVVTVEAEPGATLDGRVLPARLQRTTWSDQRWRLDRGTKAGVQVGDWVAQDRVFAGRVAASGRWSAETHSTLPEGQLLVVEGEEVVPCHLARSTWPTDWSPRPGLLVVTGHPRVGGLVVGHVGRVGADGFTVIRASVDPTRPVTIVEP
jgi:hypothetical protein